MVELRELLSQEHKRLSQIKRKVENRLKDAPEGSLRLGKSQGCVQYFRYEAGGKHGGTYLPKEQMDLIKRLAQKTYDERILRCSTKRISQIGKILKDYQDDEIEQIYLKEHPQRQKLIDPVEPTRQQLLEKWISIPYKRKAFREDLPLIQTESGLRVRSKSEKILAEYFDRRGLVYKYECPLYLETFGYVYPDFTFLSANTGKTIYWEHEGMMDNPEYARNAVKKILMYEENGIYPGENLILTFETSASVINTNTIRNMVDRYLI